MAAPGSGPSRRSHTKSRRGCKTCKRRHVRCDETYPQCNNCTKHQVRCDYQDKQPQTDRTPGSPQTGLTWSSEVDQILDQWQRSGVCSLGNYTINLQAQGSTYSKNDLFLIYHCLSSANSPETNRFTLWTQKIPKFLEVGASQQFLMHAILAFGALSLAWERNSTDSKNLAYYHGGVALRGLQAAISSFSIENADAVLATSILLSWQANDWKSWSSLITGIRTVVNSMQSWETNTRFADIVSEQEVSIPQSFPAYTRSPMTEDSRRNYPLVLQQIHTALENLQPYLFGRTQETQYIEQLRDYISRLIGVRQAHSPEEQFNHLYAFRKWLFWVPPQLLKSSPRDYTTLMVMSYFYATALNLEPLFPNVAPALCSMMAVNPLNEILQTFDAVTVTPSSPLENEYFEDLNRLLSYSRQAATVYQSRRLHNEAMGLNERVSPPALDRINSEIISIDSYGMGTQPSPGFGPYQMNRVGSDVSSSGRGSPYLDVPSLASDSSSIPRSSYSPASSTWNPPSMSSGGDYEDYYSFMPESAEFSATRNISQADNHRRSGFGSPSRGSRGSPYSGGSPRPS